MIVYINTLVAWICVLLMTFVGVASLFIAFFCLGASLELLCRRAVACCLQWRSRRNPLDLNIKSTSNAPTPTDSRSVNDGL